MVWTWDLPVSDSTQDWNYRCAPPSRCQFLLPANLTGLRGLLDRWLDDGGSVLISDGTHQNPTDSWLCCWDVAQRKKWVPGGSLRRVDLSLGLSRSALLPSSHELSTLPPPCLAAMILWLGSQQPRTATSETVGTQTCPSCGLGQMSSPSSGKAANPGTLSVLL